MNYLYFSENGWETFVKTPWWSTAKPTTPTNLFDFELGNLLNFFVLVPEAPPKYETAQPTFLGCVNACFLVFMKHLSSNMHICILMKSDIIRPNKYIFKKLFFLTNWQDSFLESPIMQFYNLLEIGLTFFNLFMTSKNETTISPIHEKCCIKAREPFKTPFSIVYFFLFITLKNI